MRIDQMEKDLFKNKSNFTNSTSVNSLKKIKQME